MNHALIFLVKALIDLYVLAFVLRMALQAVRADFYNPLSQFIVRVTDPLVRPLRSVLPSLGRIDTATLVIVLALYTAGTAALLALASGSVPHPVTLVYLAVLRLLVLVLRLYFFLILIHVILSWVGRDLSNPVVALLAVIVEPVLRPVRRLIPTVGGLDLSPLLVLLLLQAAIIAIPLSQVHPQLR